jgi:sigma-B regulation protein RsbU (phosphoserine phosphatase)
MGHGVASALVSMSVRSLLQELINNDPDPAHVFQKLNSYLVSHFASEETLNTYLTAFYMIIDLEAETIQYVNAGHPAPLIFMGDHVIALDQGTIPVGMFEEISIETSTIPIGSSGKMIIYTDGILEIFDECNKSYTNTLEALYRRCEGDFTIYRNEILHDIKSHEQIKDDICMLFIEFNL